MPDAPSLDALDLRIARLRLGPGDVLVVKVDALVSETLGDRIRKYCRESGVDAPILLVDRSVELAVLTRAEIDARAT